MIFTRREMLGAAGAAAMLAPLPAKAVQAGEGAFADVAPRVRSLAEAVLARNGFPGISIALVGPGYSVPFAAGLADFDSRSPASTGHLFQIGSITKSLTAMAVFVLAERGRVDFEGNVQALLPDLPMPPEPITVRQLLEHSSGLPNSLEQTPFLRVPGGRLWTGFAPGSRYSYCNLGYTLLGLIIERAAGMPFATALETLVLRPIGMSGAMPVVRTEERDLYASGHVRLREDIPWLPRARLTEARWIDVHTAAGSVGANAHDMVRYLERIIALGRGHGGTLFSDALAVRYRTPTIASTHGPGARYGNGLATLDVGGRPAMQHTGGMIGFSSAMTVDPQARVGAYASVNVGGAAGYRPLEITRYALALLRAAASGAELPPVPEPEAARPVGDPRRFVGRWFGPDRREIGIVERGGALFVASGGIERPLVAAGERSLATDHPLLAPHLFAVEAGEPLVLRLGGALYGRDAAPVAPPTSARLSALAGVYYSAAAWSPRLVVHALGDRLFVGANALSEAPDGSWRFSVPDLSSERIWFRDSIAGRPQTASVSGTDFARIG
ncbi:MAG TPA: serine hydrolase domain-containing protein [Allosphingosinicella sp.]|jgi:CubicO group peptidase (beta-lactamase class C family)